MQFLFVKLNSKIDIKNIKLWRPRMLDSKKYFKSLFFGFLSVVFVVSLQAMQVYRGVCPVTRGMARRPEPINPHIPTTPKFVTIKPMPKVKYTPNFVLVPQTQLAVPGTTTRALTIQQPLQRNLIPYGQPTPSQKLFPSVQKQVALGFRPSYKPQQSLYLAAPAFKASEEAPTSSAEQMQQLNREQQELTERILQNKQEQQELSEKIKNLQIKKQIELAEKIRNKKAGYEEESGEETFAKRYPSAGTLGLGIGLATAYLAGEQAGKQAAEKEERELLETANENDLKELEKIYLKKIDENQSQLAAIPTLRKLAESKLNDENAELSNLKNLVSSKETELAELENQRFGALLKGWRNKGLKSEIEQLNQSVNNLSQEINQTQNLLYKYDEAPSFINEEIMKNQNALTSVRNKLQDIAEQKSAAAQEAEIEKRQKAFTFVD